MGLASLLLSTSLNPALMKVLLNPVHAKTSGVLPGFGSTGYPSMIFAPFDIANSIADSSNCLLSPMLYDFANRIFIAGPF